MKVYITIKKNCTSEWRTAIQKRFRQVFEYENISELNIENAKYIVLEDGEAIKGMESLEKCNFSCISDGEWMIKENRIYNFKSDNKSPIIIMKNKPFVYPLIKEENLKNLYLQKKYEEFVLESEKHIFEHGSYNMLDYYISIVCFFILKRYKEAQAKLTNLLHKHPTYAEAWCLLGDMLLTQNKNGLAKQAYENAVIKGKDRDIYDNDPVWLKKYDEYPKEKLSQIERLISATQIVSKGNF